MKNLKKGEIIDLKILIGRPLGSLLTDVSEWKKFAEIEYVEAQDEASLTKQIVDADVLIIGRVPATSKIIDAGKKLKMIQTFSVGYENIDVEAATKAGIMVCNTGGVNAESVAELAWGLILGLARQIPGGDRFMREGKWGRWMSEKHVLVRGKTLGIVGFGAIGRIVGNIGHLAFNMNLLSYDPFVTSETVESFGGTLVSMEKLMKESDIISVHVPLSASTQHLIGERELRMMKPTAMIVNTSRGAVVDEVALIGCLQGNVIAGAGLDVFESEPLSMESPLRKMDNVIIVSHIGSCPEALAKMNVVGVDNVLRFVRGEIPMRIVNPRYIITLANKQ
ncbi:MAG: D-3-phosphoglycerate dehydrogenase / 2-oxoglutarate reductase [Thermoproteota archaeon]|nr:D-3-phosphoglycerate dehydrogenase / 2-oxoglutarate reductase [Thermoproteota archaeon]